MRCLFIIIVFLIQSCCNRTEKILETNTQKTNDKNNEDSTAYQLVNADDNDSLNKTINIVRKVTNVKGDKSITDSLRKCDCVISDDSLKITFYRKNTWIQNYVEVTIVGDKIVQSKITYSDDIRDTLYQAQKLYLEKNPGELTIGKHLYGNLSIVNTYNSQFKEIYSGKWHCMIKRSN